MKKTLEKRINKNDLEKIDKYSDKKTTCYRSRTTGLYYYQDKRGGDFYSYIETKYCPPQNKQSL